jgi:imidazolonepropionase-like amidohydrolase
MRSAKTFLDCGYTSCVGAASAKQRIDLVIRNAIQAGDIPGPRYLANGQEMAPENGALIKGITRFIETTDDARAAVKEYSAQGIDQIKLSMSGEEITESLRAEDVTIPDDVVAAAVEAAHEHGMRVCSHARSDESIVQCLQYGVDIIYHACGLICHREGRSDQTSIHIRFHLVRFGEAERPRFRRAR